MMENPLNLTRQIPSIKKLLEILVVKENAQLSTTYTVNPLGFRQEHIQKKKKKKKKKEFRISAQAYLSLTSQPFTDLTRVNLTPQRFTEVEAAEEQ